MQAEDVQRQMLLSRLGTNVPKKTESSIGKTRKSTARKSFHAAKTIARVANVDPKNNERSSSSCPEISKSLVCVKVLTPSVSTNFNASEKSVLSDNQPLVVIRPTLQKHILLESVKETANGRYLKDQKNTILGTNDSVNVPGFSTGMKSVENSFNINSEHNSCDNSTETDFVVSTSVDEEICCHPNEIEGSVNEDTTKYVAPIDIFGVLTDNEESIAHSDEDDIDYLQSEVGSEDYPSLKSLNVSGSYLDVGEDEDAEDDGWKLWLDDSSQELDSGSGNIYGSAEAENVLTEPAIQSLPLSTSSTPNYQQKFASVNHWLDSNDMSSQTMEGDDELPQREDDTCCLSRTDMTVNVMTKRKPVGSWERVVSTTPDGDSVDGSDYYIFKAEATIDDFKTMHGQLKKSVNDAGEGRCVKKIIPTDTDDITELKGRRKKTILSETSEKDISDFNGMKKIQRVKQLQMKSGRLEMKTKKRTQLDPPYKIEKKMMKRNKIIENEEQIVDENLLNDSVSKPDSLVQHRLRPRKFAIYTDPLDDLLLNYSDDSKEDDKDLMTMANGIDEAMAVTLTSGTRLKSRSPCLRKTPECSPAEVGLITSKSAKFAVTAVVSSEDHLTATSFLDGSTEELSTECSYCTADEALEFPFGVSEKSMVPYSEDLEDERTTNDQSDCEEDSAIQVEPEETSLPESSCEFYPLCDSLKVKTKNQTLNLTQSELVNSDEGVVKRRRLSRPPARLMDLNISCKSQKDLPFLPKTVRERIIIDMTTRTRISGSPKSRRPTKNKNQSQLHTATEPKILPGVGKNDIKKRHGNLINCEINVEKNIQMEVNDHPRNYLEVVFENEDDPENQKTSVSSKCMMTQKDSTQLVKKRNKTSRKTHKVLHLSDRNGQFETKKKGLHSQSKFDEFDELGTAKTKRIQQPGEQRPTPQLVCAEDTSVASGKNLDLLRTMARIRRSSLRQLFNQLSDVMAPTTRNLEPNFKWTNRIDILAQAKKCIQDLQDQCRSLESEKEALKNCRDSSFEPDTEATTELPNKKKSFRTLVLRLERCCQPRPGNKNVETDLDSETIIRKTIPQPVSAEVSTVVSGKRRRANPNTESERMRRHRKIMGQHFNQLCIAMDPPSKYFEPTITRSNRLDIVRQAQKCIRVLEEESRRLEREKKALKTRKASLFKQFTEIVKGQPNSKHVIRKLKLQLGRCCQLYRDGENVETDFAPETFNTKDDDKRIANDGRSTSDSDGRNVAMKEDFGERTSMEMITRTRINGYSTRGTPPKNKNQSESQRPTTVTESNISPVRKIKLEKNTFPTIIATTRPIVAELVNNRQIQKNPQKMPESSQHILPKGRQKDGKQISVPQPVSAVTAPFTRGRRRSNVIPNKEMERSRIYRRSLRQHFDQLCGVMAPTTRNLEPNFKWTSVDILSQAQKCIQDLQEQRMRLEREKRLN